MNINVMNSSKLEENNTAFVPLFMFNKITTNIISIEDNLFLLFDYNYPTNKTSNSNAASTSFSNLLRSTITRVKTVSANNHKRKISFPDGAPKKTSKTRG